MGKKKKRKAGYVRIGDVLGVDTTIVQAATLLDEASVRAIQSNDVKTMLEIAEDWVTLGAMMHAVLEAPEEEKDDHPHDDGTSSVLGFGNTETRERAEASARARKNRS